MSYYVLGSRDLWMLAFWAGLAEVNGAYMALDVVRGWIFLSVLSTVAVVISLTSAAALIGGRRAVSIEKLPSGRSK